MRLIRVHVEAALAPGARITASGTAAAHITRVLRLGAGDPVTVFNGDGSDYPATITALRGLSIEVEVRDRHTARVPVADGEGRARHRLLDAQRTARAAHERRLARAELARHVDDVAGP